MKRLKTFFCILLFLTLASHSKAENNLWWAYISPGARVSYVFGEGFSLNSEITVGILNDFDYIFYSLALGFQKIPEKPTTFIYIAIQSGQTIGWSLGPVFYKDKGITRLGWRVSGFGGLAMGFVSYDQLILPSASARYHSLGVCAKLPIPLILINKDIGLIKF